MIEGWMLDEFLRSDPITASELLLIDQELMRFESVILGGGGRGAKVSITPEVFRRLPNGRIEPGLSMPR